MATWLFYQVLAGGQRDDCKPSWADTASDGHFPDRQPDTGGSGRIYSAIHQYEKGDYAVVTASFLGSSIPGFFLSLLLIYVFTVKLGWLPSSGMTTLGSSGGVKDIAAHMSCRCSCSPFPWRAATSATSEALCLRFCSRIICALQGQRDRPFSRHQQACAAQCTRSDRDGHRHGDSGALWRSSHH